MQHLHGANNMEKVLLKIVIGCYGTLEWHPYHGASGGMSISSYKQAMRLRRRIAAGKKKLDVPKGLWPGMPYCVVSLELEGNKKRGFLIAVCEPVE